MSLNFDLNKIKDTEDLYNKTEDGLYRLKEDVETLIFITLAIGLDKISEKNKDEFYRRVIMWNIAFGFSDPLANLKASIDRCIGLKTNATIYTKAKFNATLIKILENRAIQKIQEAKNND